VLVDGALAAYLARGDRQLATFLAEGEPARSRAARAIANVLIDRARTGGDAPRGMLIEEIDGGPPALHPLAPFLLEAGFVAGAMGLQARLRSHQSSVVSRPSVVASPQSQPSVSSPFGRRYFEKPDEP
jgi:hypothetical protein